MATANYFQSYLQIINDGFRRVRKGGLKKFSVIKDLVETLEEFLSKQVFQRIEPSNYLMFFLLMLGTKNHKIINTAISTFQKLLSNNFISPNEDLSTAMRLIKQEHREFLLLSLEDYSNKEFKELYIQSLVILPEKDDVLSLIVSRNLSLIWRLSQNTLSVDSVSKIYDFLIEAILQNKTDQIDKTLKSTFLEVVRHALQSYRQAQDCKLLEQDQQISIRTACFRYGRVLMDKVAINYDLKLSNNKYDVIPGDPSNFELKKISTLNEKGHPSGKFGWCIICRNKANYYCKINKVPICSIKCKQVYFVETNQLDKLLVEESKSTSTFIKHVNKLTDMFARDLKHTDIRRRVVFAQIFIYVCSELKKFQSGLRNQKVNSDLRVIFKSIVYNVMTESQAFYPCLVCVKKMIYFRIFVDELEVLFQSLAKKITYFLTPANIREEILKFIKDIASSQIMFDIFMTMDCSPQRKDSMRILIEAVSTVYLGIEVPEGIILPEQPNNRKLSLQIISALQANITKCQKISREQDRDNIRKIKQKKNILRHIIEQFNKSQKPVKLIKKYIKQQKMPKQPKLIAQFLHKYLKRLDKIPIGILIGDIDDLGQQIRDQFIGMINFKDLPIDQGLRLLLKHFTLPGQSQVVDRIIDSFSKVYYNVNQDKGYYSKYDAIYSFSYLLMMLQTNLHNPQVVEKMTLQQFSGLSKGMNGQNDFKQDFLEQTYISIQKKQLGFHSKLNQMEIITAYKANPKNTQEMYMKTVQKQTKTVLSSIVNNNKSFLYNKEKFSLDLMIEECGCKMIDAILQKIRQIDSSEQIKKYFKQIENMMNFSTGFGISTLVEHGIKNLWEDITKLTTIKKFQLMEQFLNWVAQFNQFLHHQWNVVLFMFSKFNRNKLIRKDPTNKSSALVVINQKCYIHQHYIQALITKSSKYTLKNLFNMVSGLIQVNKGQISQNCHPYCLEKIGEILDVNNSRLAEIFPQLWSLLKDYYIELGKHRVQKIALFGADFLKQLITKFIKKKDLIVYQKDYLKPLQEIFNTSSVFGVKQYVIGSVSYFINNHFLALKAGWKVFLSILINCYDEQQDPLIKQKAYVIIRKIFQSNFTIIDLDENYVDIVQILGRLSREKQQTYPRGCIECSKNIIAYYHKKLQINPQIPDSQSNKALDIHFLQTVWLPLLSTIYGICGDTRSNVQTVAVECLFDILMTYGKLFKYQFWKMVLQGVLRPTFQEIIYTSQSKSLKKADLDPWMKNSFEMLFSSIGRLIDLYYPDFRMFLYDVLKIYQNCFLNFSSKILIQLTVDALTDLFAKVGNRFEQLEWQQYLKFCDGVLKKCLPSELNSVQAWRSSNTNLQAFYDGKCLCLYLLMSSLHQTSQKFGIAFSENVYLQIQDVSLRTYEFAHRFNKDISLRETLWKEGFFTQMKSLPGLIKQQHQALKSLTHAKFRLRIHSQQYLKDYIHHTISVMQNYKSLMITTPVRVFDLSLEEKERQSAMIQVLILDMIIGHIKDIGFETIKKLGLRQILFENVLEIINQKTYGSRTQYHEIWEDSYQRENKFNSELKEVIRNLFYMMS